jgi:cellulose synthase operon protein C
MSSRRKRSKNVAPRERPKRWRAVLAAAIALGAVALAFGLYATRGAFDDLRAARHFQRAEELIGHEQHEPARAELRRALNLQPMYRKARRRLAEVELRLSRLEHAFLEFHAYAEIFPEDADAWLGLAQVLLAAGQPEYAEAAAGAAVEIVPDRSPVRRLRAELRLRLGRYHGARVDAQAVVDLDPKDAAAWGLLARATAKLEGADAGVRVAERGLAAAGEDAALSAALAELRAVEPRLDERLAPARNVGGAADRVENWPGALAPLMRDFAARRQKRDWEGARALARSARQTYPGTMLGPWLEGVVELSQIRLDRAEAHLMEALAAVPRSHRVITSLGTVWASQRGPAYAGERLVALAERDRGFVYPLPFAALAFVEARDPARAEAAIRRGRELLPDSPVPYRQLADFYLMLDRAGEAAAVCDEGLGRFPHDVELKVHRARGSHLVGDGEGAIRAYEEVLAARPDHDVAASQLGRLLVASRKDEASRERALRLLRQLEHNAPADPAVLGAIGWMYLEAAGDSARAREFLEAAARGAPEDPTVRFHLAVAYARTGDAELARRQLRAALSSAQPFAEEPDARRLLREIGGTEP